MGTQPGIPDGPLAPLWIRRPEMLHVVAHGTAALMFTGSARGRARARIGLADSPFRAPGRWRRRPVLVIVLTTFDQDDIVLAALIGHLTGSPPPVVDRGPAAPL